MRKKITFLMSLLLLTATLCTFAQGEYQFPNADLENWRTGSYTVPKLLFGSDTYTLQQNNYQGHAVPTNWHSFDDASTATGFGSAKKNHSNRITGYVNSGYAMEIYASSILGFIANGTFSTGQTVVGSSSSDTEDNYVISKSGFRWSFTGVPDSLSFSPSGTAGRTGRRESRGQRPGTRKTPEYTAGAPRPSRK